ncbi:tyrosine-type recombinase/integrase [Companilactobacillus kedongensis]|uniref:tyrosine-type recombinase/integrase n=1 Tax=Companilactobacillus kedongensis TaxID=2486004 RepID=UPI000F79EB61|nr:tyrosine-type recombinase/integrase [Companilactobacillus kedongensis]
MATIHKRNGKWEYRVSYKDLTTGKYRNKTKGGFTRKTECEEAARKIELQKSNHANLAKQDMLFSDYFKEWVELYRIKGKSHSTVNRYYFAIDVIKKYFPNMRLVDVTKADYQHFLNEFGKTRTKVTVSKYNSFFRSMCEDAIAEQLIYTDFTRNTTIVAGKESKSPDEKFLEPDDYIKLIEVAKMHTSINDISSAEVYLVTQTGMRYEECAGLTWNDINFNKKVIRVNKAIENDTRNQKTTKTPAGVRYVDVSSDCINVLKKLKIGQEEYFNRINYTDPYNYVFRSRRKETPTSQSVNQQLKKLLNEIGSSKIINFHGIRHTHISYLLDQGFNLKYVSRRVGHKTTATTLKYYTHMFDSTSLEQSSDLRKLFNGIEETNNND